jgi:NTE family protein
LLQGHLPAGVTEFGQLRLPCYVTAVDLRSGRLFLFGEDPTAPLLEAVLASSSVPALHPPVDYHGLQLVDGGILAMTPAGIAMDKGATTIYAINLASDGEPLPPAKGVLDVIARTLHTYTLQSLHADLDRASGDPTIDLHHIRISAFEGLPFNDFSHVDEMIAAGRAVTDDYLADPQPLRIGRRAGRHAQGRVLGGAREI